MLYGSEFNKLLKIMKVKFKIEINRKIYKGGSRGIYKKDKILEKQRLNVEKNKKNKRRKIV